MLPPALQVELSGKSTSCTPQILLQQILVSLIRELEVQHLGTYSSPCICRERAGQHRVHVAKKLSGQTFIHLWVQKSRQLHLHRQSTTAPLEVPDVGGSVLLRSAVRIWGGFFAPQTSWQSFLTRRKRKLQASLCG